MPISVHGSSPLISAPLRAPRGSPAPAARGFTLIELLVVIAIIAIATAGVAFAVRDSADTRLEREAQRLAALLESGRAQSRSSGLPVRWYTTEGGFRFEGLPAKAALPTTWLDETTRAQGTLPLLLGPEPIIGPQAVQLTSSNAPGRSLRVATDGLRPFTVSTPQVAQ
jgi:general secretion pathway protein H